MHPPIGGNSMCVHTYVYIDECNTNEARNFIPNVLVRPHAPLSLYGWVHHTQHSVSIHALHLRGALENETDAPHGVCRARDAEWVRL